MHFKGEGNFEVGLCAVQTLLGTLLNIIRGKTRWQRQRERHQPIGLKSKTKAVPSSANSNVNSASFGEREPQRLIFRISIWN